MRRRTGLGRRAANGALATVVALAAGQGSAATAAAARDDPGQRLFVIHCARCHGVRGEGGEGPSLTRPVLRHAADAAALLEVISEGIPGTAMPATNGPNDAELAAIAAFVQDLGRLPPEPLPGDPARGQRLYEANGGCAGCHITRGRGHGVGPELTEVGLRRNADYLRRALTDPDADSPETVRPFSGRVDGFLSVRLVAPEGEFEGLRVAEDEFSVQLRDLSGSIHSFEKDALSHYEKAFGHSLMPGYDTRLDATEVDDLVAYLMTLKGEP